MTREEAIEILKTHHMWTGEPQEIIEVRKENIALNMAIKALEREPKWDRLYILINHLKDGIAPDETVTDTYQRHVRETQAQLLEVIMYWMVQTESEDIVHEKIL